MSKIGKKLQQQTNKKALAFLNKLIMGIMSGTLEIVHFGWWPAGMRGKYGVSIYFNSVEDAEEE